MGLQAPKIVTGMMALSTVRFMKHYFDPGGF